MSGIVPMGSSHVSMGLSMDSLLGEAVVGKDHGGGIIEVVTQEDDTVIIKGWGIGRVPREDGR
jgi:hypothetical protein